MVMPAISEFSRTFFVTPGLCNARRELPLPHLVSDIIELATDHANRLGIGFKVMTPKGVGWVLSRLTVSMKRYPRFNEHFTLTTWIEAWNRHFSVRDFAVETSAGEIIGYARTIWMVIDLKSHANAGTGVVSLDPSLISPRECPIESTRRISRKTPDEVRQYTFRYTDIDFYSHVNTVRYIELLLNQFPLSRYIDSHVERIDVSFRHEARYGDTATIEIAEIESDRYAVNLLNENELLLEAQIGFSH